MSIIILSQNCVFSIVNVSKFEICSGHCLPIIKLRPQLPLRFRQSEDFYLTRHVQFTCTEKPLTTSSWDVLSCSLTCPNATQLFKSGARISNHVFIPAQTLSFGHYELRLTVKTLTSPPLTTTLIIDFDILPTNILTRLLPFDIPTITHHQQEDLLFDPGKYSIDPSTITFDSTVRDCRVFF